MWGGGGWVKIRILIDYFLRREKLSKYYSWIHCFSNSINIHLSRQGEQEAAKQCATNHILIREIDL